MILGDIIRLEFPTLKPDADEAAFVQTACGPVKSAFDEHVEGAEFQLFKADRGDREGDYLMVWSRTTRHPGDAALHPVSQAAFSASAQSAAADALVALKPFIGDEKDTSDFALIGSDQFDSLYSVDILGLHFLKVLHERSVEFEELVRERLNPTFKDRMPGMPLLYYRGISGRRVNSYLLVFAIETKATREAYFPTDQPETKSLYKAFEPLKDLGKELVSHFEDGTWLDPSSGGAASYFESLEWTDFVQVGA